MSGPSDGPFDEPPGGPRSASGPGDRRTAGRSLLDRLIASSHREDCPPFALLHRRTPGRAGDRVEVLTGPLVRPERLAELPVGDPTAGACGALALLPFRQIRERGFEITDDGTPLIAMVPEERAEVPVREVTAALPAHDVRVRDGGFDLGDEEYARIVERVVREEIGTGQGANFVVRRSFRGTLGPTPAPPGRRAGRTDFRVADALVLFRRLLAGERGAYWTFLVHTGDRTLVGASPEVHVRMAGGTVVMNPISGTYRYPPQGPDVEGLLEFLADRKEREELSMVVDEELKMMCTVADRGGVVVGPRLKEMSHLAHTEYELRGRTGADVRDVLRQTMFAATVTGSPVENACRVISRYEHGGRGYYAGALALLGHDRSGTQSLDSPILIRALDIAPDGRLALPVGATLVRDSDPAGEVAETRAKAGAVLTALGVRVAPTTGDAGGSAGTPRLAEVPRVQAALAARRADLAPFWLKMQPGPGPQPDRGHALVVDGEDTFTSMLAHLLRAVGLTVTVRRFDSPGLREAALGHEGPVVLGPGPGDPGDPRDPRITLLRGLAADLIRDHRGGLLGVCLGHELIAAELGLEIVRRAQPFQGAQERIDLFGAPETVGFYNSYTARCDDEALGELALHGVTVARDTRNGEVHALRGPGFAGVQFHPESVLTLNGPRIVRSLLDGAVPAPVAPAGPEDVRPA
ncbi:phenazine-specific anthranilate synthase component I [Streptomyces alkaliphilus]|uniref:anthranilate synthase n=1 Tax=Streptomyces alkaliphilus TaxID=1472722 RepID=A0A7W3TF46_9ACTN|nr:phenazine-specific anthranilate synthase component I [Streptomyces alkaliphilus]